MIMELREREIQSLMNIMRRTLGFSTIRLDYKLEITFHAGRVLFEGEWLCSYKKRPTCLKYIL